MSSPTRLYIALISVHGLIRGHNLQLGCDSDTGGQTLYVVELANALSQQTQVAQVDLFTRRIVDNSVATDYGKKIEILNDKLRIIRVDAGPDEYIAKEKIWDHLSSFADNVVRFFNQQNQFPDIIHSHYADAGWVGSRLSTRLAIPLIHTGHSLGRVKRNRLLASGLSDRDAEQNYNLSHRIEAEELTLATADRVITSTHQEIEEQYELYDYYQPAQMCVIPPGTDLNKFTRPSGGEMDSEIFETISRHLKYPQKPIVLALSRPDKRKNIGILIEAFGLSLQLQELANLVIVAGNRDDIDDLDEDTQDVFHDLLIAMDRYDLYGKVALPKHHRRDQVGLIYRIAAASGGVFVNPALTEPFGLTLIEAAASGLPIVATEDGGPQDIISNCHNGFLIDPLDPSAIADALLNFLTDKQSWKKYADHGIKGVRKHYAWDAHAKRYLKLINPIIERSEQLIRNPVTPRQALYSDRAIVSDLDQNLLGNTDALQELLKILRNYRKTTAFIIATGRRLDSALKLMKQYNIPQPDILITSSGTEIYYAPKLTEESAWTRHIDHHWTPHTIRRTLDTIAGLEKQPKQEQSRFKLSYYIDTGIADIDAIIRLLHQQEHTVNAQLAFGQYLDILPLRASKGLALRYVADRWQIPLHKVFVAGGSGADEDMMRGNTLAAVVANRHHEELSQLDQAERIYFAQQPFAAGIIEALHYYDFFASCRDPKETTPDND
jgi:sucrose-phosphate synthase